MAKTRIKNNNAKTYTIFLIGLIFFYSSRFAIADIIINEFISHPNTGEKEWVELLNTGNSPVDLMGWKLTELSSPSTNPTENDFLSLSGVIDDILVFEISSSKLNDTGDSIGLYNEATSVDRVTFGTESTVLNYSIDLSTPSAGKSGAFISGKWKSNQVDTKGAFNTDTESVSSVEDEENIEESSSSDSTPGSKEKKIPIQKTKVQIITKPIAYVGIPFVLEGSGTDEFGEKLSHGRYYWNFGDGDFREVKVVNTDKFVHAYFYGGDYVITLEYFPDSFADTPVATQKITVKVIIPEISISAVGGEKDFFIELSNKTSYDVDISNWTLLSDYKVFKIPRNTIIQTNKKIVISPKITNFSIQDKNSLRLITSSGDMVASYSSFPVKQPPGAQHSVAKPIAPVSINSNIDEYKEYLPALTNTGSDSSLIFPIISLIFIGGSASAVYFIRRKKAVPIDSEDFEILDE